MENIPFKIGCKTNIPANAGSRASLKAQQVKNLPAMQETQEMWVQALGWEDPLEEEMASPVFMPEKSCGHRSLVDSSSKGCKVLDTTELNVMNSALLVSIVLYWKFHSAQ